AIIGELATFHSPEAVILAAVAAPHRRQAWDWMKWLPHSMRSDNLDAAGPRRLVVSELSELELLLADLLEARAKVLSDAPAVDEGIYIVVVSDVVDAPAEARLSGQGLSGVTVIDFDPQMPRRMQPWFLSLEAADGALTMRHMDN